MRERDDIAELMSLLVIQVDTMCRGTRSGTRLVRTSTPSSCRVHCRRGLASWCGRVHNFELHPSQGLGENIGDVVGGLTILELHNAVPDELSDVVMAHVDMFAPPGDVLRLRNLDSRLIIFI